VDLSARLKKLIREKDNRPTLIEAYELGGELKRLIHHYNLFQEDAVLRIQKTVGGQKLPALRRVNQKKEDIDWSLYGEDDDGECQVCDPESLLLYLPSNMTAKERERVGWEELSRQEAELREGTIRETLTELRLQLGQRVMRYKALRGGNNQKDTGRMYQGLKKQKEKIREITEAYRTEVRALVRLKGEDAIAKKWKDIKDSDLAVTTEERTTRTKLAWFWHDIDVSVDQELEESPQMENCEYCGTENHDILPDQGEVYRVNYLRAKARWDRWKEEQILVKKEMGWRIAWFEHANDVWSERERTEGLSSGARVYAAVQAEKWRMFAWRSRKSFSSVVDLE